MIGSRTIAPDVATDPKDVASEQTARILFAVSVAILIAVDLAAVIGAFVLAYAMRFVAANDLGSALSIDVYLRTGIAVAVLSTALLALQGVGDIERVRSWPTRLRAITAAVSTGTVIAVIVAFDGDLRLSRVWLALGWSLAICDLVVWRSIAPALYLDLRRRLVTRPRALVVGANALGQELARELEGRFEVIGYVDNGSDPDIQLERPLLAAIADLDAIVRSRGVDEIVVALPPDRREQVTRVMSRGFGREVEVKIVPEFGEHLPRRLEFGRFGTRTYIGYAPIARVTWIKRAVDLCLATVALIASSPLFLGIAIAVKLNSTGPVIYRQRRVGKDGRSFDMLKFRSMCDGAEKMVGTLREHNEASGPLFKIRRDPRITTVGRFLRRFSLDELPQLINVVVGEMSLVGPRPPLPSEVQTYEEWQLGRLQARPGMTGLWQVSGRSEVPFNDMIRLDLHYVRNWSFGLDLEIMLRTIPAVLANRGAY
jgi:exopolysaccharide biosynthesis polyprenyl glycosylphosphotransferase